MVVGRNRADGGEGSKEQVVAAAVGSRSRVVVEAACGENHGAERQPATEIHVDSRLAGDVPDWVQLIDPDVEVSHSLAAKGRGRLHEGPVGEILRAGTTCRYSQEIGDIVGGSRPVIAAAIGCAAAVEVAATRRSRGRVAAHPGRGCPA